LAILISGAVSRQGIAGAAQKNHFVFAYLRTVHLTIIKGTVQRKLTGVLSGINRKLMICHCSDGCSFFNLKGLRSLNSKNMFSALTGALL
jgi:hypothetical protein